jgi:hypothetical protein
MLQLFENNNHLNDAGLPSDEIDESFDKTYLFFETNKNVDYKNLVSIYLSLPPPTSLSLWGE